MPIQSPVNNLIADSSMFGSTLLEPQNKEPQIHLTHYDYTVSLILFFSYVLFVWLYATNRKRLNQVIKAFYISRFANQLAREEISFGNRVSLFLSSLFVITVTLFAFQINKYYGLLDLGSDTMAFLVIAVALTSAYLLKIITTRFFGYVFKTQREAGEYTTSIFLFGNTLGLFMMPVVICLAFAKQVNPLVFIYTGLVIMATFLCARLVRGLIIGINSVRVSRFYLFLYLCTLEILPFVILVKIFMEKVK